MQWNKPVYSFLFSVLVITDVDHQCCFFEAMNISCHESLAQISKLKSLNTVSRNLPCELLFYLASLLCSSTTLSITVWYSISCRNLSHEFAMLVFIVLVAPVPIIESQLGSSQLGETIVAWLISTGTTLGYLYLEGLHGQHSYQIIRNNPIDTSS